MGRARAVRWHQAAFEEFEEIVRVIAQDSPRAAAFLAESVFAKTDLLGKMPYLGRVCPYYRKARQLVHGKYLIYYTVHRKEVVIRAVVHGARLFHIYWLRRPE